MGFYVMFRWFAGLEESRDELQAAAALQAGRELLMLNPCNNNAERGPSLAVELLAGMNPDQVIVGYLVIWDLSIDNVRK